MSEIWRTIYDMIYVAYVRQKEAPSPSPGMPKGCASNPRFPPRGRAMPRPYQNNSGALMPNRYYEKDGNLDYLAGRTAAIIGYGSQGHAHALNLRDSGVDVVVGLPAGSKSIAKAEAAGLKVLSPAEAAKAANVVMILVPDHIQADLYNREIAPHMTAGKTLMFAHGFNIHFGQITPPADIDVTDRKSVV